MAHTDKVSYWELITNGIVKENTIFKLALSLCPSIAVTSGLKNGVLMGAAVLFVQVMVNITISLMRKFIHPKVRLPIFMLVISGWVTVTDMSMAAAVPDVYKQMGLYIQLIVAFASILARAEMFASKNKIAPSMADGIGMGIGFLFALTVISFFRELIGKGSLWGMPIVDAKPLLIMILPAGGFFAVGILMAFFNWIDIKFLKKGVSASH
ncbi:MAG: electron transport complex subunit RsxE [Nitrospirae bacterium]|jgi:electron transport complex protein RnfE|nr:electron transport complex subunit RsxE [Nitrospirota bacterium]MCL5062355.1 electron transport complex subunit RsxE [Nitrospirota bacterium]MDA8213896.1 electron transport complex subunit RsxE [Nitrospiraceae bacterium]